MLLQGGCWPPGLLLEVDYHGTEIEWQYTLGDQGAAVVAIAAQGPIGSAKLCSKPARDGSGRGVLCARVGTIARIVPGECDCTSLGVLPGPKLPLPPSAHPVH